MRKWARNTGRAALVAAGAVAAGAAFGPTGAVADTTSGNFSVLGGNQVHAPISIPIEASGNAAALLGAAQAQSMGGASVEGARHGGGDGMQTSGNFSIGGGNQIKAPISIPVDVCGNAIAIVGLAKAQCKGGASVSSGGSDHGHGHGHGYDAPGYRTGAGSGGHGGYGHHHDTRDGGMQTSGNFSVLGGNQVYAPISVPVNVCGNAVAVLGAAQAQCKGGASVERNTDKPKMKTSGNFSILGGNQVYAPISVPVNVCGNSVAVLGLAQAQCKGGASVGDPDDELPPTLRTVQKKRKIHKPSVNLSAVGKKLTSKLRGSGSRTAPAAPNYRTADGLPAVQEFLDSLKKSVSVPGVDVKPGNVGPQLPAQGGEAPVEVGSPVLN
ncbi:chaplin family protein [Actinomadura sp. 7K507]|uniref:chaplin family protein n=1 Tax=Actinomadura sp. 7K507 TaxID=2530365 RepID=UPI001046875B|nr:chaplin family protein [Actinomadura sp. 7K507]TDC78836.1 chaplin [Actinomadura sp. 7K507]